MMSIKKHFYEIGHHYTLLQKLFGLEIRQN